jgi:hypothetical protein
MSICAWAAGRTADLRRERSGGRLHLLLAESGPRSHFHYETYQELFAAIAIVLESVRTLDVDQKDNT